MKSTVRFIGALISAEVVFLGLAFLAYWFGVVR
jgi:hypothetical protein